MGKQKKPVKRIDPESGITEEYESIADAADDNFTDSRCIRTVLDRPDRTCRGYRWVTLKKD